MHERPFSSGPAIRGTLSREDASDAELLERFVTSRDEAAFAALMSRHGPMVFGVCRRFLCQAQDAEDAFQATFLILVRKAARIGKRELLGNWLYGVALRVASRARLMVAKRRMRETMDIEGIAEATRKPAETTDVSAAITEEVQRLPAKYRIPVVLCYLEGRSNEEAASEIRCPVGTVKTRLSRAREMLRNRLTRRGLALSTTAFSTALSAEALGVPLPPALIDSTFKAAMYFAAGDAAAPGLVSTQAAALTKGVLRTMFVKKLKTVALLVLGLTLMVSGASGFAYHVLTKAPAPKNTDGENIQGTWIVESAEAEGKEAPVEAIEGFTVIITADKVRFKPKDEERSASYKLDPEKKPKVIELTPLDGPAEGKPQQAIYELDGDRLKLCLQNGKGDPPTEFATKVGDGLRLLILKRMKK